jgi:circadian clock protein KaiB
MSRQPSFKFLLYVADDAENSAQAVTNLTVFCRTHLPGRHKIEVVDVYQDPKRAMGDRILMTPTLIKLSPAPMRRIIGTLSQPQVLVQAFGLEPEAV